MFQHIWHYFLVLCIIEFKHVFVWRENFASLYQLLRTDFTGFYNPFVLDHNLQSQPVKAATGRAL